VRRSFTVLPSLVVKRRVQAARLRFFELVRGSHAVCLVVGGDVSTEFCVPSRTQCPNPGGQSSSVVALCAVRYFSFMVLPFCSVCLTYQSSTLS